jgi:hypothetical protein
LLGGVRPMGRVDLRVVWRLLEKNKADFAPHGWPVTSHELERITVHDSCVFREKPAAGAATCGGPLAGEHEGP